MAEETKKTESMAQQEPLGKRGFPDPSITLIEFGDGLGVLLAARTERHKEKRRLILKKVAYIRLGSDHWGVTAFPEVWVEQNEQKLFVATEPHTGRFFHDPSRRRYEVAFLSKELFDCAIQCIKDRDPRAIYELVAVTFGTREGFSVENEGLVGPEDYASERQAGTQWIPYPTNIEATQSSEGGTKAEHG